MLSLVQPVTLNLRYAATSAVDKSASIVHTLPWVHLKPAYRASLVGRVIFVIIVILKGFPMLFLVSGNPIPPPAPVMNPLVTRDADGDHY